MDMTHPCRVDERFVAAPRKRHHSAMPDQASNQPLSRSHWQHPARRATLDGISGKYPMNGHTQPASGWTAAPALRVLQYQTKHCYSVLDRRPSDAVYYAPTICERQPEAIRRFY